MVKVKAEFDLLQRLIWEGEERESLMFTGISALHLSEITCHSCHSDRVGGTVMLLTFNFFSLLLMKLETFFVQPTVHLLVFPTQTAFTSH